MSHEIKEVIYVAKHVNRDFFLKKLDMFSTGKLNIVSRYRIRDKLSKAINLNVSRYSIYP